MVALGSMGVALAAHRREGQHRAVDQRTKVQSSVLELRVSLEDLAKAIPLAVQSRERVSAATGRGGALDAFRGEAQNDNRRLAESQRRIDIIAYDCMNAPDEELAAKLIDLHAIEMEATQLHGKYQVAFRADEEVRRHLRDAAAARVAASQRP